MNIPSNILVMVWSQDLAYSLERNFIYLIYPQILHTLILALTSFATAITAPYCCYFWTNSNTNSCISALACLATKLLCIYKVVAWLPTFEKKLFTNQHFSGYGNSGVKENPYTLQKKAIKGATNKVVRGTAG